MSELLLDTIALDLLLTNPAKLPAKTRKALEAADTVYVSVVSLWELGNHVREGQFKISVSFESFFKTALRTYSLTLLPMQWEAMAYMSTFSYQTVTVPFEKEEKGGKRVTGVKKTDHKDTFDRMLIAHALTGEYTMISPDTLFPYYEPLGLKLLWK